MEFGQYFSTSLNFTPPQSITNYCTSHLWGKAYACGPIKALARLKSHPIGISRSDFMVEGSTGKPTIHYHKCINWTKLHLVELDSNPHIFSPTNKKSTHPHTHKISGIHILYTGWFQLLAMGVHLIMLQNTFYSSLVLCEWHRLIFSSPFFAVVMTPNRNSSWHSP